MKRVIIESPYAGNTELNLRYLRACMDDCIHRGESPYASHGLYTQPGVLRDSDPKERELGILAGFAWRECAELTVVYGDLGITPGMQKGIDHARSIGQEVDSLRMLGGIWKPSKPLVSLGLPTIEYGPFPIGTYDLATHRWTGK